MRGKQMKITVLDRCTVTAGDVSLAPIEALGNVRFYDTVPHEKLADVIADSDAVICNKAQITDEIMEKCKKLRYIGLFATGYNNIDIAAAKRRGITVCNVPGYSTDSVVQHAFSMILHFACGIGSTRRLDKFRNIFISCFPDKRASGKNARYFRLWHYRQSDGDGR